MILMQVITELIEEPLESEQLAEKFRGMCNDRRFENLQGKLELDSWGRILLTPADNYHGAIQGQVGHCLAALPGGQAMIHASIVTSCGLFVADVAWASDDFRRVHNYDTPYVTAPEICVEVVSRFDSRKQLQENIAAYLSTGAIEVWIVYPSSERVEFFGAGGQLSASAFPVDLTGLFD
jgi:Uma2 family endonuclease